MEIPRLGGDPRLVQVLTGGESLHLLGHGAYDPVYEACCEMGLVFALHPGTEGSLNSSTSVGRTSSYFEWHNSLPLTYQAHLGSLVTEGTFEKFSELRVMFVEGGLTWLAPLLCRAFPSKLPVGMRQCILYDNAAELYGLPSRAEVETRA